jgi:hypothetical protein
MAAKIPDLMTMVQMGIDPTNGMPTRIGVAQDNKIKEDVRRSIRIMDEQEAVNRYTWYGLPSGLNGQLLERIIYYRGQAAFFYLKEMDQFYFLPYALNGGIDPYGRFESITPLPFLGGTTEEKNGKVKAWIEGLNYVPVYSIEEVFLNPSKYTIDNFCIILKDYTPQESENVIPRKILQERIIDLMAEAFPMARTNLIANCGVNGLRVQEEDTKKQVEIMNARIKASALNGDPYTAVFGPTEFQELTGGSTGKVQDFLMYMQSIDNFRRSMYGLKSGGVFEKKAHELQAEAMVNQSNTDLIYNDGLKNRQAFCDLVNLIFGLTIWCEPSETAMGIDMNMNGNTTDGEEEQQVQPQTMEGSGENED